MRETMMSTLESVLQPGPNSTFQRLKRCASDGFADKIDVAVAYITSSGLVQLLNMLDSARPGGLDDLNIRWLTSFDYKRTDPASLSRLLDIHGDRVRIFAGK